MSAPHCEQFRGLIALAAIGIATKSERVGLEAHLEGCRECREDGRELDGLSALLAHADLDRLYEQEMPAELAAAVLGQLQAGAGRERLRRRIRHVVWGGAAAAVVALALALTVVLGVSGAPGRSRTVALAGEPGVHASVQLTPEAWGTSLRIDETGQPGSQVLWVSMRTSSGTWWAAGSYRTLAGRSVKVDLACALATEDIRSVWIKDSAGRVVLHAYLS